MGLSQETRDYITQEAERVRKRQEYLDRMDDWTEIDRERCRSARVEILVLVGALLIGAIILSIFTIRYAKAEPVRLVHRSANAAGHDTPPFASSMVGGSFYGCPPRRWCGCWLMRRYGKSDKRLWVARQWAREGRPAVPGCIGCVAVLTRGRGGHVGVVQGYEGNNPIILSGNQNNAVGIAVYPASRVIAYREI